MTTKHFTSLKAAAKAILRDAKARDRRVRAAVPKVARRVRDEVARKFVPIAFRELVDSLRVELPGAGEARVIADAPHSEAVELGTKPHTPPLAPLVRWVQLRGMQGLSKAGGVKSIYGRPRRPKVARDKDGQPVAVTPTRARPGREVQTWRKQAGRVIATSLKARLGRRGAAAWLANARAVSAGQASYVMRMPGLGNVDPDTVAIARAIQAAISKRGTKPVRYMWQGAQQANGYLDQFVRAALPDRGGNSGDATGGDGSGSDEGGGD